MYMTKLPHPDWSGRVQLIVNNCAAVQLIKKEKALGMKLAAYFAMPESFGTLSIKIPLQIF